MPLQIPSPAGEGGAGRVCLAAGARSTLSRVAFTAQYPTLSCHWFGSRGPAASDRADIGRETREVRP